MKPNDRIFYKNISCGGLYPGKIIAVNRKRNDLLIKFDCGIRLRVSRTLCMLENNENKMIYLLEM